MPTPDATDRRLTDLEVKACYTDDLLDHLNRQVAAQQTRIDLLLREVARLRRQLPEDPEDPHDAEVRLRHGPPDERPPHY